jgi:putative Mg2+ transporter-C (MgtC) family protein
MPTSLPSAFAADALSPVDLVLRLLLAAAMGFVLGLGRERLHKAAGLRTHILVCVGSAIFVLASLNAGASLDSTTRVIQGIVQGIGFLGAGTILKLSDRAEVQGLTTAASVWLTAAVGVSAGLGELWLAVIGTGIAWLVLGPLNKLDVRTPQRPQDSPQPSPPRRDE